MLSSVLNSKRAIQGQYTDHEGIYSAKGVDSHPWRSEKEA